MLDRWRKTDDLNPFNRVLGKNQLIKYLDASSSGDENYYRSGTNINDVIEDMRRLGGSQAYEPIHDLMRRRSEMYGYLRDYGAQTYGHALQLLMDRQVDPMIVSRWVKDGRIWPVMHRGRLEYASDAIKIGYPELRKKINNPMMR